MKQFLIFAAIFVAGIALILVGMNAIESKMCRASAAVLDVKFDYGFWSGCNVKVGESWVPLDNYLGIAGDNQ